MHIQLITVGKLKEKYWNDAVAEYTKRLGAYAKLDLREVPDEKAPENMSAAEGEQVKEREGERILAAIKADAHVVALAIEGLVATFKLIREAPELLPHAASLLLAVGVLLAGWGVFETTLRFQTASAALLRPALRPTRGSGDGAPVEAAFGEAPPDGCELEGAHAARARSPAASAMDERRCGTMPVSFAVARIS